MSAVTRVIVRIERSELATYEFDGAVDVSCVNDLIGTGEYDPVESNIKHEDIDVLSCEVRDL